MSRLPENIFKLSRFGKVNVLKKIDINSMKDNNNKRNYPADVEVSPPLCGPETIASDPCFLLFVFYWNLLCPALSVFLSPLSGSVFVCQ